MQAQSRVSTARVRLEQARQHAIEVLIAVQPDNLQVRRRSAPRLSHAQAVRLQTFLPPVPAKYKVVNPLKRFEQDHVEMMLTASLSEIASLRCGWRQNDGIHNPSARRPYKSAAARRTSSQSASRPTTSPHAPYEDR